MFGLEKEKKTLFEFDLQTDIKQNPNKGQEILKKIEKNESDIQFNLRNKNFSSAIDSENGQILLNGYSAMRKVLDRLVNKK